MAGKPDKCKAFSALMSYFAALKLTHEIHTAFRGFMDKFRSYCTENQSFNKGKEGQIGTFDPFF